MMNIKRKIGKGEREGAMTERISINRINKLTHHTKIINLNKKLLMEK